MFVNPIDPKKIIVTIAESEGGDVSIFRLDSLEKAEFIEDSIPISIEQEKVLKAMPEGAVKELKKEQFSHVYTVRLIPNKPLLEPMKMEFTADTYTNGLECVNSINNLIAENASLNTKTPGGNVPVSPVA